MSSLKLGIEVDGDFHFITSRTISDNQKDEFLQKCGIKIVRLLTINLEEDYSSCILNLEDIFRERAKEVLES